MQSINKPPFHSLICRKWQHDIHDISSAHEKTSLIRSGRSLSQEASEKDLLCCFYIAFYLCFQCVYGIKLHFAADIFHPFQGKAFPIDFFIKINDEGFDCFFAVAKGRIRPDVCDGRIAFPFDPCLRRIDAVGRKDACIGHAKVRCRKAQEIISSVEAVNDVA